MRIYFYCCPRHSSYWKKKAILYFPVVCAAVAPVCGGYMGFESRNDFNIWSSQK